MESLWSPQTRLASRVVAPNSLQIPWQILGMCQYSGREMASSRFLLTKPIPTLGQVGTPRQHVGLQNGIDSNIRQLAGESASKILSPQALGVLPCAVLFPGIVPSCLHPGSLEPRPYLTK